MTTQFVLLKNKMLSILILKILATYRVWVLVGSKIVYVENRNGRSNAAILQHDTLERMFEHLKKEGIQVKRFRADSASYTFEIINVIDNYSDKFYVKARMSQGLASAIALVKKWKPVGKKRRWHLSRRNILYTFQAS